MSSESRAFVWLSEILEDPDILEPPKPIVPRIVWKERVTLLAAREKAGKSTLASAAAAAVSSGRPFLMAPTVPGNVLIISLEEHPNDFAPRLVRFGADPSRIAIVSEAREGMTLIETIWKAAEQCQPSLIIWDTLGAFANRISGKELESGDSQGWTTVMLEILAVAREYAATLILHHARKSDGKYRDSSAIGANVDVIFEMDGPGPGPRTLKGVGRFSVPETRIQLEPDGLRLLETEEELRERVRSFVGANPRCSWSDLRQGVGARDAEVQRARDQLLKKGILKNVGNSGHHSYMLVAVPGMG